MCPAVQTHAPGTQGRVLPLGVATCRLAGPAADLVRFVHGGSQSLLLAGIASQTEDVVHGVGLTLSHQLLPGEAGISPLQDFGPWPPLTYLANDASQFVRGAFRSVDIRASQPSAEKMRSGEDVERQVAVTFGIAVKEATFLLTV